MKMLTEDFNKILNSYIESQDVIITNARGFWEKAPVTKSLIINTGLHILLKKEDLIKLAKNLDNSFDVDKFYIMQEFCSDIDMPDVDLIINILNKIK